MAKNDNVGKCGHARCAGGNGCYFTGQPMKSYDEIKREGEIAARLDYLRGEIKAERISYDELAELRTLAEHIPTDDVTLREWAGICEAHGVQDCKHCDI